jgi:hypothetical protein
MSTIGKMSLLSKECSSSTDCSRQLETEAALDVIKDKNDVEPSKKAANKPKWGESKTGIYILRSSVFKVLFFENGCLFHNDKKHWK